MVSQRLALLARANLRFEVNDDIAGGSVRFMARSSRSLGTSTLTWLLRKSTPPRRSKASGHTHFLDLRRHLQGTRQRHRQHRQRQAVAAPVVPGLGRRGRVASGVGEGLQVGAEDQVQQVGGARRALPGAVRPACARPSAASVHRARTATRAVPSPARVVGKRRILPRDAGRWQPAPLCGAQPASSAAARQAGASRHRVHDELRSAHLQRPPRGGPEATSIAHCRVAVQRACRGRHDWRVRPSGRLADAVHR